jgi:hypothetical protein
VLPLSNFSPDDQAASSEKILHAAARHVDVPLDAVENEELGFRTEVGGVAQAGRLQVGLGALGDRTRVAVVTLAVGRLDHVAGDDHRGLVEERVDEGGFRVRHQQHVGRLDALPAGDRRTIERVAFRELVCVEGTDGHADVLFLATGVGETEINELDLLLLDHLQNVLNAIKAMRKIAAGMFSSFYAKPPTGNRGLCHKEIPHGGGL